MMAVNSCKPFPLAKCVPVDVEDCSLEYEFQSSVSIHATFELPQLRFNGYLENSSDCLSSWRTYGQLDEFQYHGYVILEFLRYYTSKLSSNQRGIFGSERSFVEAALRCFPESIPLLHTTQDIAVTLQNALKSRKESAGVYYAEGSR